MDMTEAAMDNEDIACVGVILATYNYKQDQQPYLKLYALYFSAHRLGKGNVFFLNLVFPLS